MSTNGSNWAIVLAAGDGSRLSNLTKAATGRVVPKQFCSLRGGPSLLEDALARAACVVARKRILVVVPSNSTRSGAICCATIRWRT